MDNALQVDVTTLPISYSCIKGGYQGTGNLTSDPLFEDEKNANYHLSENSPCIDAGIQDEAPETDIEKQSRLFEEGIDMGAYESSFSISHSGTSGSSS